MYICVIFGVNIYKHIVMRTILKEVSNGKEHGDKFMKLKHIDFVELISLAVFKQNDMDKNCMFDIVLESELFAKSIQYN